MFALGESKGVEEADHLIAGNLEEVALNSSHRIFKAGVPIPMTTKLKQHGVKQVLDLNAGLNQCDVDALLFDVSV